MLLAGTHPRTLDDKKRLALPRRIRGQIAERSGPLFIAQGLDRCLWLYDERALEELAEKLDRAPATDVEARIFRRLFFAQMEAVDIDKAGRILVPDRLIEYAGLTHSVVLLGVRDHLELWDADRWKNYLSEHGPHFDKVAEGAFRK